MNLVFGMSIHFKREIAWYGAIYKRRLLKGAHKKLMKIGKAKSDEKRQGEGVLKTEKWTDAVYGCPYGFGHLSYEPYFNPLFDHCTT